MRISLSLVLAGMITAAFYIAPAQSARAASLNVVGGQLVGATGVNVGGTLFDVEFVDGTCVDLFSGCDNAAEDFAFQDAATAILAAQALLDQVFSDGPDGLFDTDPSLTFGCEHSTSCRSLIPITPAGELLLATTTVNTNTTFQDIQFVSLTQTSNDSTTIQNTNWAIFSPTSTVPLPLPGLLLGGAVFAAFGFAKARHRRTRA